MPICELCGEPMPEGEEMFKYHGYSGPCPRPPLKVRTLPESYVVAEMVRERRDDGYWIGVRLSDGRENMAGPFETRDAADRALDDLKAMSLSLGGIDVPGGHAN